MSKLPEPVGQISAKLGEGPCWDPDAERLVWVDIIGEAIHEYDPASGEETSLRVSGQPGCAVLGAAGELLVAVGNELLAINRKTGDTRAIASLPENDRLRFNDGKLDPLGRLWVGTMDRKETDPIGSLYRFDGETFEEVLSGITVSNGMGWSPDADQMYYIDSPRREVWAFDFELRSGQISNRRTVARFKEEDGFPDGMTVDPQGRLWVAFWGGGCLRCLDPATGAVLEQLDLPASQVTSCAFGGSEMSSIFITTAQIDVSKAAEPLAGRLFIAR